MSIEIKKIQKSSRPRRIILRKVNNILLRLCYAVYKQNTKEERMKGCILPFPMEGDLEVENNYRGITITTVVDKVDNAWLLNFLRLEISKILRKNHEGFQRNRSTTSQILTIREILETERS